MKTKPSSKSKPIGSKKQTNRGARVNKKGTVIRTVRVNRKTIAAKEIAATSKRINVKNEVEVASKAVAGGQRFFAKDITMKGKDMANDDKRKLIKKESKGRMLGAKLKDKLAAMGRSV